LLIDQCENSLYKECQLYEALVKYGNKEIKL
jgi:hypothetical protein